MDLPQFSASETDCFIKRMCTLIRVLFVFLFWFSCVLMYDLNIKKNKA